MKKLFSILIISCLLIYIGGYHLVYSVYQYGLQKEMRTYLQHNPDPRYGTYLSFQLSNNVITDPSVEWEKENEELRYKGELYDIVTVHRDADSIRIFALKDDRENKLEKQLAEIHHTHPTSSSSTLTVLKFFSVFHLPDEENMGLQELSRVQYASIMNISFYPAYHEVHTPPPRC